MAKPKNTGSICGVCLAKLNKSKGLCVTCPWCRMVVHETCAKREGSQLYCPAPGCYARITIRPRKEMHLEVSGTNADEVERVGTTLLAESKASHFSPSDFRSPWVSGLFYLFAAIVLLVVALVAARVVHIIILPVALIFGVLSLSIVGALQLRQDNRLSEKNFLALMLQSIKSLPLLRHNKGVAERKSSE